MTGAMVVDVASAVGVAVVGALGGHGLTRLAARLTISAPAAISPLRRWLASATASAAALTIWLAPMGAGEKVALAASFAVVLVVSLVDLAEFRIPDIVIIPSSVVAAVVGAWILAARPDGSPAALAVGAGVFSLIFLALHAWRPEALGLGDVKLALVLGLLIGARADAPATAVILVGGALLGAASLGIVHAAARVRGVPGAATRIPFGPSLSAAGWLTAMLAPTVSW